MGNLVFGMMQSLDGYVAGVAGGPGSDGYVAGLTASGLGIAAARCFAQSTFQRSRPRPGRQFVRSSYGRSDALLG